MKYYLIAGEASGDLHASNLVKHLKKMDNQAEIRAWGGDLLQKQGAEIVKNYKDLAFMGFVEVTLHLKTILSNIRFCKKDILSFQPDVVILVDYPGFNLRIAKFLHKKNIRIFYYISPQIWAWHTSRVKQIKRYIDEVFVILPFEQAFYAKYAIKANYLGHPLLDVVKQAEIDTNFKKNNGFGEEPIIALLPGSRKQEIENMLPVMLEASKHIKGYRFVIAGVEHHAPLYKELCKNYSLEVIYNQTYSLLAHSFAALVTSGTATLETALFNIPQVVCYKGNFLSYLIAKHLIKNIKYISLVNLIADKEVVVELIQQEMNEQQLKKHLHLLIEDSTYRQSMLNKYKELHHKLGEGNASELIAEKMLACLKAIK
ncbi:MAG: lipid-A-disaccharide synthase [Bacteroidales bacterium]|jgi:lipid-A-disaccharide synthase|nr:lipid-A-disaccharide synthase [Bacteroidales bacterium]